MPSYHYSEVVVQSKHLILPILIAAFVLRLVNLDQSLWLDEATSILAARNLNVFEIINKFSPGDFHPPLYYLFLKIWLAIFGSSAPAARMLSVILGTATVYTSFLLGSRLFSKSAGLLAALFLATAPLHIYYSQEARMYVPATFLATLFIWFFTKTLDGKMQIQDELGIIVSGALLIYTDYLPILLFGVPITYLLLFKREKLIQQKKEWLTIFGGTLLLTLPWLPILAEQFQSGLQVKTNAPGWWQTLGKTNLKQLLLVPVKFTIGRISLYNKLLYGISLVVPGIIFGTVLIKTIKFSKQTKLFQFFWVLWLWLLIPLTTGALLGLYLSVFSYFRFLFVLPAFYLLLASGVFFFKNKNTKIALGLAILLINVSTTTIYLFNPRFHRENWKDAVSWVDQQPIGQRAASIFVTKNQRDPYFYYAKRVPAHGPEGLEQDVFDTIYLMRYVQTIFDPNDTVRQKIENMGYQKQEERDFNGVTIWRYEK